MISVPIDISGCVHLKAYNSAICKQSCIKNKPETSALDVDPEYQVPLQSIKTCGNHKLLTKSNQLNAESYISWYTPPSNFLARVYFVITCFTCFNCIIILTLT